MTGTAIRFRAHQARTRPMTRAVSVLLAGVRDWRTRRRAAADLWEMNDSRLADIGIGSGDIPAVVDGLMAGGRGTANVPAAGQRANRESGRLAA